MTLPTPSSDAIALSNQLLSQIIAEIKMHGSISFARYMELALYAPQLGYYQNGYQKFGKEGDFVTSPEISALFSYCLANQCADILADLKGGDIIEFGAGSGVMAADILGHLQKIKQLPNHYFILELSATLQSQQYETLSKKVPELLDRVVWLSELPKIPIKGIILANEVLDAMPVNLFTIQNGIKDLCVTCDGNNALMFIPRSAAYTLPKDCVFPEGYTSEINLFLPGWIKSISDCLVEGAAIIIDYGFLEHEYYHPDRSMGTLMCHYRHRSHGDPFFYPGLQDITAHVDFTAVAENAEKNGFSVRFMNQARFLLENNLLSCLQEDADEKDEKTRFQENQQIRKLTSPNEMGELFKAMLLEKKREQIKHDK
ncbi:MAG: SAM-dependent methyltransferase [Coxiellaceae bacterium]|nr:SAM-dependent methyltransferase [Coxiellaceae bacterium]